MNPTNYIKTLFFFFQILIHTTVLIFVLAGCGTCLTSHPLHPEVYLVGTEEGLILRCSRAYSRAFLGVLNAHHMPVHAINYNSYDGKVFATCSGDWRVKIWEDGRRYQNGYNYYYLTITKFSRSVTFPAFHKTQKVSRLQLESSR